MSGDPTDEEPQSGSGEEADRPLDSRESDATEPPEEERPDAEEPDREPESDPDIPPEKSPEAMVESDEDAEEDEGVAETRDLAPQADLSESWANMDDRAEQYQVGDTAEETQGKESGDTDGDGEEARDAPKGDSEEGADEDDEEGRREVSDEESDDKYTETKVVPEEDDGEEGPEGDDGQEETAGGEAQEGSEGGEEQPEAAEAVDGSEDEAGEVNEAGEEETEADEGEGEKEGEAEREATEQEDDERDGVKPGHEDDEGETEPSAEEDGGEEDEGADEGSEQVEFHDDTTPIQRKTGPESDQEQPLADHIEEMVKRLAIVVIVAGMVSLLAFPFGEEFINFLWYSVLPSDISKPHVYHPLELVITQLKAASLLGLVLALPVFVYETYAFMRPGLYPHERRYYLAAVPTSLILAFVGLLFGYFLVLPAVMTYFLVYSKDVVDIAFALGQTFNLMLILLGYLALVFQIPLFIMLAIMMGLTTRTWLEDRRLIFWGAFLGISFLFSPDPTGMAPILVAATMIALFEGTLLLLRWTKRGG